MKNTDNNKWVKFSDFHLYFFIFLSPIPSLFPLLPSGVECFVLWVSGFLPANAMYLINLWLFVSYSFIMFLILYIRSEASPSEVCIFHKFHSFFAALALFMIEGMGGRESAALPAIHSHEKFIFNNPLLLSVLSLLFLPCFTV